MPPGQSVNAAAPAETARTTPLPEALKLEAQAASKRVQEANTLYSRATKLLEGIQKEEDFTTLPLYMRKAFAAYYEDFSLVTRRHIGAYIRGLPKPPAPYSPSTYTGTNNRTTLPKEADEGILEPGGAAQLPTSYAEVASLPLPVYPTPQPQASRNKTTKPRILDLDHRLFVRLPLAHPFRQVSSYSILSKLKTSLGEQAKHIKDIQATKTGFAIQPPSREALQALEASSQSIRTFFGNATIDKASNYNSYRVQSLP